MPPYISITTGFASPLGPPVACYTYCRLPQEDVTRQISLLHRVTQSNANTTLGDIILSDVGLKLGSYVLPLLRGMLPFCHSPIGGLPHHSRLNRPHPHGADLSQQECSACTNVERVHSQQKGNHYLANLRVRVLSWGRITCPPSSMYAGAETP